MTRNVNLIWTLLASTAVVFVAAWILEKRPPELRTSVPPGVWTMLNVTGNGQQGDAHLIQFDSGVSILIDAGYPKQGLTKKLRTRGIRRIDVVILTHAHRDHYGGLSELLDDGLSVGKLFFNEPNRERCDRERPWGCDYADVGRMLAKVRSLGIPVQPLRKGLIIAKTNRARLEVLEVFDGVHSPVGLTDINDMSPLMLLTVGKIRALFTGDLNASLGEYFAGANLNLAATLLKVPHHGAESTVPNSFLDRVSPLVALVPAPKSLWDSPRGARLRSYFAARKIPAWINGQHGDVTVTMDGEAYSIKGEWRGKDAVQ